MKKLILFLAAAIFLPMTIVGQELSADYGILIYENPANEKAEFKVSTPEATKISVLVYDNQGNVMFSLKDKTQQVGNSDVLKINWDLTGRTGRRVAAGTYIIQATARSLSGNEIYQYFAQLGVRR